jgi:large subunit ribosomal protein L1
LELACKIGDEAMTDEHIAENVLAILSAVEKKLPSGMKNMGRITIKKSMASTVTASVMEVI